MDQVRLESQGQGTTGIRHILGASRPSHIYSICRCGVFFHIKRFQTHRLEMTCGSGRIPVAVCLDNTHEIGYGNLTAFYHLRISLGLQLQGYSVNNLLIGLVLHRFRLLITGSERQKHQCSHRYK